jgi:succinyl-CoA synthetase beta subunit
MLSRRFITPTNFKIGMNPTLTAMPRRFFDLHEFHSKKLMAEHGLTVPKGELARSSDEAFKIAQTLSNKGGLVVKAQV